MAKVPTISAEMLRRARIQQGLTQQEVADRLGIGPVNISLWENGRNRVPKKHIGLLREILGLSDLGDTFATEDGTLPGPTSLGVWINRTRQQRGLSVADLAFQSGISVPTIYNIESGRNQNPHDRTIKKLERVLKTDVPEDVATETREEASVKGLGELQSFDPYDRADWPKEPGIYVFYDISDRPIYVGQGKSIRTRIRDHEQKFWYKRPIVEGAAYLVVADENLRTQIEETLIKFLKSNAVLNRQNVERN